MHRRTFLFSTAALAAMGLPAPGALAVGGDPAMKFIFVFAQGGWDPTRVFADGFDIQGVAMEPGSERASVGEIDFIHHVNRPSVARFFEQNYQRTLVLNGLLVPSIAHEICTMLAMTGTSQGTACLLYTSPSPRDRG